MVSVPVQREGHAELRGGQDGEGARGLHAVSRGPKLARKEIDSAPGVLGRLGQLDARLPRALGSDEDRIDGPRDHAAHEERAEDLQIREGTGASLLPLHCTVTIPVGRTMESDLRYPSELE